MNDDTAKNEEKTERVPVTVSIQQRYLDEFDAVVRRCKRAGLHVTHELRVSGVLTGTIVPAKIAALTRVEGVDAVERERVYQIPPRDSDVQ